MTDGQTAPTFRSRPKVYAVAVIGLIVIAVSGWWVVSLQPERLVKQARSFQLARDHVRGEQSAVAAMAWGASNGDAELIAAECAVEQRKYDAAIAYLQRMQTRDPRHRLRAALLAGDLNLYHRHRLWPAEMAYRAALEVVPDHFEANTRLAQLLGLCGRMREAVPVVLRLVRTGIVTDLLILLAKDSGVVHDDEALTLARQANPDDPDLLMAMAWHAAEAGKHDDAMSLLKHAIEQQPELASARVALGQQLLITRRYSELSEWLESLPPSVSNVAETWFIRAAWADDAGDRAGAIRCYWEGLKLAPESRAALAHLCRLLAQSATPDLAEKFADQLRRFQALETIQNRMLRASNPDNVDDLLELAHAYEAAGRIWEAYGWCSAALQLDDSHPAARHYHAALRDQVRGLPLQLVSKTANVALAVDLSNYPLPQHRAVSPVLSEPGGDQTEVLSLRDDARTAGFAFRYRNGTEGVSEHRMYEFTGGGMAVLDYDRDGFADLYCTQGRFWSPRGNSSSDGDRLFRNIEGKQFVEISGLAGIQEAGFGQGATIGDFNSDGFADIYVANIGANQLWMNNGDGTFADVTLAAEVGGGEWTTSCVMADLNADGLPDLYAVSYVTADDVFDRICRNPDGSPTICMPFDFRGQRDRLWLNEGNGHFADATSTALSVEPTGMGLGIAVWDAHGRGRPSLLVANDTTPNFFFVNETKDGEPFRMAERGMEVGLALTGTGKATGCMGIAVGDLNGDGLMDLNITNFLGESNTLYLSSTTPGVFDDQTEAMGLRIPTARVLGFGTQFVDLDLDGRFELFMANGHIDDLTSIGRPYRMPPLLFRLAKMRFVEVPADPLGNYFQRDWIGRSAARLDWNRDGRDDLVVGHLYDDYALLTNTTATDNRFLSIQLTGVQSNRDAVGTTLKARVGQHTIVRQVTAGDGYQASNERRVVFGIGHAEMVDELEVRWPSGAVQRFYRLPASQELLIVEGRDATFPVTLPNQ